ncbi:hypothetical protein BC834DRAFT_155727 [Gloeopeniophorella convolvens]|nr:hypothetical protein BC834DRAFT_155727 [Gloeopeniophorella convolvens]
MFKLKPFWSVERDGGQCRVRPSGTRMALPEQPAMSGKYNGPVVVHAKFRHLRKVMLTNKRAFVHDPMMDYLYSTDDARGSFRSALLKRVHATITFFALWRAVRQKLLFTIEEAPGSAFVNLVLPIDPSAPLQTHDAIDRAILRVLQLLLRLTDTLLTPQQMARRAEISSKAEKARESVLPGDEHLKYFYIGGIATDPESQGHGYGTALMRAMNAIADEEGKPSYLDSSNVINTGFYNSVGYKTAAEYVLGDDNPDWKKQGIVVRVMIRAVDMNQYDSFYGDEKASPLV